MLVDTFVDAVRSLGQELRAWTVAGGHPRDPVLADIIGSTRETAAGVPVDHRVAENYSAFYRGVRCISEPLATFPRRVMRKNGEDREPVPGHPLNYLLNDRPNDEHIPYHVHELCVRRAIILGNGPCEIVRNPTTGRPESIWPIHPHRMTIDRMRNGALYFSVSRTYDPFDEPRPDDARDDIPAEDILNVAYGGDGLWGCGIVGFCRESLGIGIANDRYGGNFYGKGAKPGGVVQVPNTLNDKSYNRLKDHVNSTSTSSGAYKTLILEGGAVWAGVGQPPSVAQFIETRNDIRKELGIWLSIPGFMLGEQAKFANVEEMNIWFLQFTLMPWIRVISQAYKQRLLLPSSRNLFVKIAHEKLLQGDIMRRTQALKVQFMSGALTINEWRALEDRNAIGPDGNEHYVPLNMTTAAMAAAGKGNQPPVDQPAADDEPSDGQPDAAPGEPTGGMAPEDQDRSHESLEDKMFAAVSQVTREFAHTTLRQTVADMLAKEEAEMAKLAESSERFLGRVEAWYNRHQQRMASQLMPVQRQLHASGVEWSATVFAEEHCDRAVRDMIEVCGDITAGELSAAVAEHTRQRTSEIMEKLNSGAETRDAGDQTPDNTQGE